MKSLSQAQLSAVYSFLFPGLGQIYRYHYAKGLIFFLAFTVTNYFLVTRIGCLFLGLFAGWEAYQSSDNPKGKENVSLARKPIFMIAAGLGFFSWFLGMAALVF